MSLRVAALLELALVLALILGMTWVAKRFLFSMVDDDAPVSAVEVPS